MLLAPGLLRAQQNTAEDLLPPLGDLRVLASSIARHRAPLLVLFSTPGCPYCREIRRNYLAPRVAEQADKASPELLLRETDITSERTLTGSIRSPHHRGDLRASSSCALGAGRGAVRFIAAADWRTVGRSGPVGFLRGLPCVGDRCIPQASAANFVVCWGAMCVRKPLRTFGGTMRVQGVF